MRAKNDTTVRTSVMEVIVVTLVCIIAFLGLVYMKLMPYIGSYISEQQTKSESVTDGMEADLTDNEENGWNEDDGSVESDLSDSF